MTEFHRTAAWSRLVRKVKPVIQKSIDAGEAICIDCGRPVLPGEKWQVGHRLAHKTHPHLALEEWNVGPSHGTRPGAKACNQREGARLGNRIQATRKKRSTQFIEWKKP